MNRDPLVRKIRVSEYIAEVLEAEADRIPLGLKDQADILRNHGKMLRADKSLKMVKIREIAKG